MSQSRGHPTGGERLTEILDALERVVEHGRAMPMSTSVLVNRTEVLNLLEQARGVVPRQAGAADKADGGRGAARAEAERIVAAARAQAAELVRDDAVVRAAGERAAELTAEAEATADRLRREADDYCDRRLAEFEIDLGRVLAQVQAGRAKLADRLGDE